MATFDIVMPKMGESIQEATIVKWFKNVGDKIEEEDILLEIATDKVDSEIPSPIDGVLAKVLFEEGALVPVGEIIAVVDMDGDGSIEETSSSAAVESTETPRESTGAQAPTSSDPQFAKSDKFFSPLVKNIASSEGLTLSELEQIEGSGHNGRVRKQDVLGYIESKKSGGSSPAAPVNQAPKAASPVKPAVVAENGDQVIEMDRMRRLIADHMVMSKQVSPHVTNFIEADVTNLVLWRNKVKGEFEKREGQKITFMPLFIEAVAQALKEYPGINASVDGYNVILRKNINVGVAVALPSGNLIVPVVKNADQKSLLGLTVDMNRIAAQARENALSPDDIAGGTFTISNFGSFKNLIGTPIINQPQVAILATGNIEKKPAVLETPTGDVIAIRHKMMLALSYDHRVIDGSLGGNFLRRVAELLEQADINRTV